MHTLTALAGGGDLRLEPARPAAPLTAYDYRVQRWVTAQALRDGFGALLFRSSALADLPARTPLASVIAMHGREPVGLAALERLGGEARLLSLFVAEPHRGRGMGRRLLELSEQLGARLGAGLIAADYRTHWPMAAAFERLLLSRGWRPPVTRMIRYRTSMERAATSEWVSRAPAPPPGTELFPWIELTAAQRRQIESRLGGEVPRELTPFQMPETFEPLCSVGLRRGDAVLGWMVCHRLRPPTVQQTALYVDAALRDSGAGLALAREATRRQFIAGVPNLVWEIRADNAAMLKAQEKVWTSYLTGRSEVRATAKTLASADGF